MEDDCLKRPSLYIWIGIILWGRWKVSLTGSFLTLFRKYSYGRILKDYNDIRIVKKLNEKDDPILWATYLLYTQYNTKYYTEIKTTIERILIKRIEAIRVQKSIFEYREFWWIIVFNKCPFLSSTSRTLIDGVVNSLTYIGTGNRSCADIALDVFVDYLRNNDEQFFEWDMLSKDFLRTITFKTHEKSIFKNYKENIVSLVWGSI